MRKQFELRLGRFNEPILVKTPEGLYVCEIPIENEPEDGATDEVWWKWAATGVGGSPREAYEDWTADSNLRDREDKV